MRKVLKITWLPGWSIGMDAEPSHWFCAHPSTICSVGHQLHHLMDELPMPCPALVPDFTSLQGPAKRSRRLRMRGLAEVLLKTQDRVGTGGRSVFRAVPAPSPALCSVVTGLHIPHRLPSSGLGLHVLCVERGLIRSHELHYPTPNNPRRCTGSFAAEQTELRLEGHRAPVLALLVPTALCPAPLSRGRQGGPDQQL